MIGRILIAVILCLLCTGNSKASQCGDCGEGVGGAIMASIIYDTYMSKCKNDISASKLKEINNLLQSKYGYSVDDFADMMKKDSNENIFQQAIGMYYNTKNQYGGCSTSGFQNYIKRVLNHYNTSRNKILQSCTSGCFK